MYHREIAQHVGQRTAHAAVPVDYAQHPAVDPQPALEQVLEQRGAQRRVFGRALPYSQHHFAPVAHHAERHHHGVVRNLQSIKHQDQQGRVRPGGG